MKNLLTKTNLTLYLLFATIVGIITTATIFGDFKLDFPTYIYLFIQVLFFVCLYSKNSIIKMITLAIAVFLSVMMFFLTLIVSLGCIDAGQKCVNAQNIQFLLFRITLVLSPILIAVSENKTGKK